MQRVSMSRITAKRLIRERDLHLLPRDALVK